MKQNEIINNRIFEKFKEEFSIDKLNKKELNIDDITLPICVKVVTNSSISYMFLDKDGDHVAITDNEKGVTYHFGNYFNKFDKEEDVKIFAKNLLKYSQEITQDDMNEAIKELLENKYEQFINKKIKYGRRQNE
jgi:hypothetical protein